MATTLDSRAALRSAFYTRMDSGQDDEALAEHYGDADEAANKYIQQGLDSAQMWVIEVCDPLRWLARFGNPLTWQTDEFGRFVKLPVSFLRLSGDDRHSAIIDKVGNPWGRLLDDTRTRHRERFSRAYFIANDKLYLVQSAPRPPTGSVVEYHYRHPILTSDESDCGEPLWAEGLWAEGLWAEGLWAEGGDCGFINFPEQDRWLIVAYAAWHAIRDDWPAGGQEMQAKIERDLAHWQQEITRRHRLSRSPKRIRTPAAIGPNLLLGRRHA